MLKVTHFFIALFLVLVSSSFANFEALEFVSVTNKEKVTDKEVRLQLKRSKAKLENHRPVVKITTPKSNSRFEWNTTVPYTITVSDPEDGESEYQEINSNDVFLEVKYVADAAKATALSKQAAKRESPGLAAIKASNCFNCHTTNTKLIGPSYYDISKRYPYTNSNTALLIKHIREGSTGVWGTVSMPTHPELTQAEAQNMVQWIYKEGAQSGLNIYRGLEGSFRIKPPAGKQNGVYILT